MQFELWEQVCTDVVETGRHHAKLVFATNLKFLAGARMTGMNLQKLLTFITGCLGMKFMT